MALDWLHKSEQPIRSKLTQLLTGTTTHKFPPQVVVGGNNNGYSPLDQRGQTGGVGGRDLQSARRNNKITAEPVFNVFNLSWLRFSFENTKVLEGLNWKNIW